MLSDLDPVMLARIQFAFTISFHIIFPSFTIGTAAFVATLMVRWHMTGREHLRRLARFWTKIFAVSFAMGVVSGIVLSYQFGTNWSRFSVATANVIGPLIGYEVLTAFFLEATFLGIMLFGWNRVPPWLVTLAAAVVAVGTMISAFWILSANSWMHTPQGYVMRDGIAFPTDWIAIVFNPSFPYRFAHMLNAAYLTTSLVVLAVGARYMLAGRFEDEAKTMMRMAIGMIAILAPLQLVIGDQHGLNTLKYQPAKIAAMEGHWDGSKPVPLVLFAWPDEKTQTNRFEISIPNASSLILTHDWNGLIKGLKDFPVDQRPPVLGPFFAFRIMVGLGLLMIVVGLWGAFMWWRGTLFTARLYQFGVAHFWWSGFVAVLAGWFVTENGRQPFLVYGVMRTADGISPVASGALLTSLVLFVLVYGVVFAMGIYYINRLIAKGPQGGAVKEPDDGTPSRPLSGAAEAGREMMART